MIQVATDPDGFFRTLGSDPELGGPARVVALMGVPLAAKTALYGVESGSGTALLSAFTWLVAPFLLWVGVAALFQTTTRLVGATGGFRATLGYVGWGFVPAVVSSVLNCLVAVWILATRGVGGDTVDAVQGAVESSVLFRTVDAVQIDAVFLLWAGFLWVFAVQYGRNVSRRDAAVTAGLPIGVLAAIMLLTG